MSTQNHMMVKRINITLWVLLLLLGISCDGDYIPKPRGYFRIDFPEKKYVSYDSICPFKFSYPVYAEIKNSDDSLKEPCSFNIEFPQFRAKVYMTYKTGKEHIPGYIEDSHKFVYKHTIKADAINEKLYIDTIKKMYGVLYEIKGNAASSVQFFMTDSVNHFLRGSLYFDAIPNKDSLLPVIRFLQEDIVQIIETLEWKNN